MEIQKTLFSEPRIVRSNAFLHKDPLSLEQEKNKFLQNICTFLDPLDFENFQVRGRPRKDFKDVIKSLLVMSYNSRSYRRTTSDLEKMYQEGMIKTIPTRSTLNRYSNDLTTKMFIEKLIQVAALFFMEGEDTAIVDSTWFSKRMYGGGYEQVHDKRSNGLGKARKIHVVCLRYSKVIAYAKASEGTRHDSPEFEPAIRKVIQNGFNIRTLIADAGYLSKDNYSICKQLGIEDVFINFKSNTTGKRPGSDEWRKKIDLYKNNKKEWNETYRFRVIIEGVFSAIKRKNVTYLRSKKETAQDVEILLKALVYNITIIGKYS